MSDILIGMTGDLLIDRPEPDEALEQVKTLLGAADILFGNLEASFSDDPKPMLGGPVAIAPARANLEAFARAGLDVLSMANNHIVDLGRDALLENLASLKAQGIQTCGAGANIAEARRPAIVEAGGVRMAFLAYSSVFPMGYEAHDDLPGLVPLRAYDVWQHQLAGFHMPGTLPRCSTVPDEADLAALADDIARAKADADLVFTSFHWGDFLRPYHLTDHETRTARWCIDQGVDMVIGHHHHALRGMEWYKGKPILYGLGHFVFDLRLELNEEAMAFATRMSMQGETYAVLPREGWPLLPLHPDTRMTVFAYAKAGRGGVSEIGFVPCRLLPNGQVVAVDPESDDGREIIAYVERCNSTQGLNGSVVAGDPVAGHAALRIVGS